MSETENVLFFSFVKCLEFDDIWKISIIEMKVDTMNCGVEKA